QSKLLELSSVPMALYMILVLLGIFGNAIVISVVGESILREPGGGRNSDMILVNMAFSNLMVSMTRNMLLVISDTGLEVLPGKDWCQILMGVWVWLRSVNVWSTFFLSAFHFHTLRRTAPPITSLSGPRGLPRGILTGFGLIWSSNLLYSVPAFIYSTSGGKNATETLMLVSSTTRPLLGCLWDFPSVYSGLAFATTSMVIHEIIPIVLMSVTNLGSLLTLYAHERAQMALFSLSGHINYINFSLIFFCISPLQVILALILLFIVSWGASVISVNYFNYNRGASSTYLLVLARFFNSLFIALSPLILAVGHRRLRQFFKSIISH
uniref:Taste receptor type 2 n=1 Tax=Astyanax mexicanus TaxID=7994 RepID=A0A8B9GWI5_ASTMX